MTLNSVTPSSLPGQALKFPSRKVAWFVGIVLLTGLLTACATSARKPVNSAGETQEEVISALESVTGAIASPGGEKIEAKKLIKELRKDPEAQSAMKSIAEGIAPQRRVIRYCPTTGEHFGPNVEYCPGTKIPLVEVEE